MEGYECDIAWDGREAMKLLNKYQFDLVTTGIKMPRMTGVELLTESKKHYPKLPIIIISGILDLQNVDELKAQGAFACFQKGKELKLDHLLESVRKAVLKFEL
jgi:DNA-binding NtrC family response regulator